MITPSQIQNLLDNHTPQDLERLACQAEKLTRQYFGHTISLYAPIYLSNFCSSYCTYCGFHSHHKIERFKLTQEQMHQEMKFVSGQGIENVLLLTGESYKVTPLSYLKDAVTVAREYFPSISLEVHPMEKNEYRELFECGVDGITVYQETYDRKTYKQVHISGIKADYDFRYGTPERAALAGMRQISMGILLGLSPHVAQDLFDLYKHLRDLEKKFPGVEYSLSFPRLRSIKGESFVKCNIDDMAFTKIICLTRSLFPRVGINLSTREEPRLRDHILNLGITRMSAGSNTAVGGYTLKNPQDQNPQFDVSDHRSVQDIVKLLKMRNFDPVLTDWRRIENSGIQ
jgi:2-iminoacetate synthase